MLPKATGNWTREEARHLLNRAGFGGSPNEIDEFYALGREKAVESLLVPNEKMDAFPLPAWVSEQQGLSDMQDRVAQRRDFQEMADGKSAEEVAKLRRDALKERQKINRRRAVESQGWWFRRILLTKAPLREKMTLFWHDHFATSIRKVKQPVLMMNQNQLFREQAFGSFYDLTQSIVRDPAMMLYLDIQRSSKTSPNENFSREVMELFTLGEGNYTEKDVKEAARAFTGFQLNRFNGNVVQNAQTWDAGEKIIFGKRGKFNGSDVVKLIFKRDACAKLMANKLWEYFAYESPADSAVEDLARTFREADYQIKPLLREIFLSKEFYGDKSMATQIKSPVQYLVQLLKELEMKGSPTGFPLMGQMQLGQVLFMPPNVAGWDWGKAWINTNTLLTRYNFAGNLLKGSAGENMKMGAMVDRLRRRTGRGGETRPELRGIASQEERRDVEGLVDSLIKRFFNVPIPSKARASFIEYAEAKKGINFTDRELGELCHLILSTPYYQIC
ncbi:MAG: DUF1800 family protein [Akkermansiaceae bacterium]